MKTDDSNYSTQTLWIVLIGGLFIIPLFILFEHPLKGTGIILVLGIVFTLVKFCNISIPVLLLAATFFSDTYLGDIKIGPVSPRVYLALLLFLYVFTANLALGKSIFKSETALRLTLIYAVFACWTVTNDLIRGDSLEEVAYAFSSSHLLAILFFVEIQAILKDKRDIKLMLSVISIVVVCSAFVAIMQWFNISYFWDLAFRLHPGEVASRHIQEAYFFKTHRVPGMAFSSENLAYHLITFGGISFAWTLHKFKNKKSIPFLFGCLAVLILLAGLLLTESRSALAIVFICMMFLAIFDNKNPNIFSLSVFLVPVVALTLLSVIYLQFEKNLDKGHFSGKSEQFDRIVNLEDEKRKFLLSSALSFIQENIIIGGGSKEFKKYQQKTMGGFDIRFANPHNLFLNSMVYYGLLGLIMLLFVLRAVYLTCVKAYHLTSMDATYRWIALGAIIGLLAYCSQGFFHSDSFVDGGTWSWWLLGTLCALIAQQEKCEPAMTTAPEKDFP